MRRIASADKMKLFPRDELVIALDGLDFSWYRDEISAVIRMWEGGQSLPDISDSVGRCCDEVFLLLLHLARNEKIKTRKRGCLLGVAR